MILVQKDEAKDRAHGCGEFAVFVIGFLVPGTDGTRNGNRLNTGLRNKKPLGGFGNFTEVLRVESG